MWSTKEKKVRRSWEKHAPNYSSRVEEHETYYFFEVDFDLNVNGENDKINIYGTRKTLEEAQNEADKWLDKCKEINK